MTSSRRRWSKSEKLLLFSPVLVLMAWLVAARPSWIMERLFGWPRVLKMPSGTGPGTELRAIALSADGRIVAAGGYRDEKQNNKWYTAKDSGDVYVWDTRTGQLLNKIPTRHWRDKLGLNGYDIWGLALSPNGTLLTRGLVGDKYRAFDIKTGQQFAVLPFNAWRAVFSRDGKLLAGCDGDKVRIWNVSEGKMERTLVFNDGIRSHDLEISPNRELLACIKEAKNSKVGRPIFKSSDGPVQICDIKSGRSIRTLPGNGTVAVSFSPDGLRIVSAEQLHSTDTIVGSGADTGRVQMCDVKSGRVLWTYGGDISKRNLVFRFRDAVFTPDGKTLAVDNMDGVITLFNSANGRVLKTLKPVGVEPSNIFTPPSLAFSGNGKLLVSRAKNAVLLWDIKP